MSEQTKPLNPFLEKIGYNRFEENVETPQTEEVLEETNTITENVEVSEGSKQTSETENIEEPNQEEEYSFTFEQEEAEQQEVTPLVETKVKDKVKYDLKSYVDSNYDTLSKYIKYRDLDVESMSNEDLVRNKLKFENPSWSNTHIEQELQDTYGIGLKKVELPEDEFSDEYRKAQAHNERVEEITRRGERLLISEVSKAKKLLTEERERVLNLPEVELDVELTANPQQVIEQYQAQALEQHNKFLEEIWKPNIETAVSKIGVFKQPIDLGQQNGDKVISELKYKFTDSEKEQLKTFLESYVAQPSDDKYITNVETGEVDYQRFVNDKALQLFAPNIIKSTVKDLTSQFKEKFIKEEIVNYSDEPKRKSSTEQINSKNAVVEMFRSKADSIFKPRN